MWPKSYRDYKQDQDLIKNQVESGKGIKGCEMHEFNGWGNTFQSEKKKKKGIIHLFLEKLFSIFKKKGQS
jgi:hypothetical protein